MDIKSEPGRGGNLLKLSDTNDEHTYNKNGLFARKANSANGEVHAEARP